MEKIIVNPLEIRGLGNIVSPKTLEDFEVYDAELSFEDSVYTLVYDASSVSVGLSVSSSSITVGGSVVLTAEVLSAGEPAVGEIVSFYDGSTLLGTDEIDSDGIATYTASSLGVGSHSLTAEALDKSSSAVTVTVNKLTSTITISVPSTGTVGTSYTVSGTLVPTSGSVKLYENGSLKDPLTVSSGSFSKAITQSNEGTYSYYAVFEGSSTYSSVTSSTGSIVVSDVPPVPVVTSVSLTGDKSILSYADSESATLSATVLDSNDDPMSDVTVEFFNGSTSMGTADTNSSGVATKTYASTGAGDLSFTASVGTIVSETFVVQDCFYWNDNEIQITGTNKHTLYDSDLSVALPTNAEISFDVNTVTTSATKDYRWWFFSKSLFSGMTYPSNSIFFDKKPSYILYNQNVNGSYKYSSKQFTASAYATIKYVKNGTTVKVYVDGTLMIEDTVSWIENYSDYTISAMKWSGSETMKMKNVKFKAL